jgi:hypothetical protein
VKRLTKAAIGSLAGCALALGGTQLATGALLETHKLRDVLTDLLTIDDGPFDSARAKTTITQTADGATFAIRVTGIDTSLIDDVPAEGGMPAEGYGGHLHVGPCNNTGGHYKYDPTVPVAIETNEVWFTIKPNEDGMAYDVTSVPFVPEDRDGDGDMSIVIHVNSAAIGGTKQACFPLPVRGVLPVTSPTG